jgi:exopolysaccharide production protein ExoY
MSELAKLESAGAVADFTKLTGSNGVTLPPIGAVQGGSGLTDAWLGRVFDLLIATVALIVFAPLMLLIALLIRISGDGPVVFVQQRIGKGGLAFPCLKFRSMVSNSAEVLETLLSESADARDEWRRDQKLRNDPRITPIGRILRKTSLDELPQLFNIIAGQMSIVGPRPIVSNEIERYGSFFDAYCSVRPGLTGMWQISGRNDVNYDARVQLDTMYASRKSVSYDFMICVRTIPAVLASKGCY